MKRVLFVCSYNQLRSPTAENLYTATSHLEVRSAGLSKDARTPLTTDMVEWADVIFVMEKAHHAKLFKDFGDAARRKHVICLDILQRFALE